jgi:uncharacterized protein (TIGR00251 family)
MPFYEEKDDCIILNLRVGPRASKNEIQGVMGDALKVRIMAPPVEGKANACLIRFLSKHWNVPRARFKILSGETGRSKRIRISNPPPEVRRMLRQIG